MIKIDAKLKSFFFYSFKSNSKNLEHLSMHLTDFKSIFNYCINIPFQFVI